MRLSVGFAVLLGLSVPLTFGLSECLPKSSLAGVTRAGGAGSDLELNTFGRYLEHSDLGDLDIDAIKRLQLYTIISLYNTSDQFGQVLRLCQVQEAIAQNDDDKAFAHRCKLSSLVKLGRFSEAEELLLLDVKSPTGRNSDNVLAEIQHWQVLGELALYQGDVVTGKQAYESVLELTGDKKKHSIDRDSMLKSQLQDTDGGAQLRDLIDTSIRNARIDALRHLARVAYFRQDSEDYFRRAIELLRVAATNDTSNISGTIAIDLAPAVFRMGNKPLAVDLARFAHAVVKADAGFRDQIEPLENFPLFDVAAKVIGDEQTSRMHVVSRLRLARVYMLLERFHEAKRLLDNTLTVAERYILEEPAGSTLIAEVEEAEGDLLSQMNDHAGAIRLLRSARRRRILAGETERSSALGRRHLEFDSPVLAVNARLLGEMARSIPMPISEPDAVSLLLEIMSDFSASRADRSLRQASKVALAQNEQLRNLLSEEGILVDRLMDFRSILSAHVGLDSRPGLSEIEDARSKIREILQEIKFVKTKIASVAGATTFGRMISEKGNMSRELDPGEIFWQWILHPEGNVVVALTQRGLDIKEITSSMMKISALANAVRKSASLENVQSVSQLHEYPVQSAAELFQTLFPHRPIEGMQGSHWILAPQHPLDQIPWSALVTQVGSGAPHGVRWLIEDVALTLVPSIETWRNSRKGSIASREQTFLGIGDPENDEVISVDQFSLKGSQVSPIRPSARVKSNDTFSSELRAVSDIFPATNRTILAGPNATKAKLLRLPLQDYRVILFSTHGFLAGDVYKRMGPALLLTAPVDKPSDRFLVPSDVVSLRLDADVVILSACDTSGPDGSPDAEAFSGLTSAFLLAGARSVVATLWPVERDATSSFVQYALHYFKANPTRPFSYALQQAALLVMREPVSKWRHPAFWSPFVVIGH